MNIKTHKKQSNFNDYVVVAGSLNKKVNPYKACIYGLCRDFLCANGYDLGTKYYSGECIVLSSVWITWGIKNKVWGTVFI